VSNTYPAIPDPQPTVESLTTAVRMLKLAVELLTAQRAGAAAARVYVQETAPTPYYKGDLWIIPSTGLVRYWNASQWVKITIT